MNTEYVFKRIVRRMMPTIVLRLRIRREFLAGDDSIDVITKIVVIARNSKK